MYNAFSLYYERAMESTNLYEDDMEAGMEAVDWKGMGNRVKRGAKEVGSSIMKMLHAILEKIKELIRFFGKDTPIYLTRLALDGVKKIEKMNYRLFLKNMQASDIDTDLDAPSLDISIDAIRNSYKGADKRAMTTMSSKKIEKILQKLGDDTQTGITLWTKFAQDGETDMSSKMNVFVNALRTATNTINTIKFMSSDVARELGAMKDYGKGKNFQAPAIV